MQETINDRMERLVNERFDGNKAAFAKAIGLQPTAMSSYLSKQRRSKPSVDMVAKIVTTLNVDARWLIIGEEGAKTEIREAGRDYVESGKIEHKGTEYNGPVSSSSEADLRDQIAQLKSQLADKERIIKLMEEKR